MNVIGLDRVVLAVPNLQVVAGQFAEHLELSFEGPFNPETESLRGPEPLEMLVSAAGIEIITPENPNGAVARFLDSNGPGLYALSLRVSDLDVAAAELADSGVEPVGKFDSPAFREQFYHPSEFGGALVILAEYEAPHGVAAALSG